MVGTPLVAIGAALAVAAGLRVRIGKLSHRYEALLAMADQQSQRAEEANRVKDEFLATLSHELRTPLNSILGWARLLASGKLNEAQTSRAVAAIERAGWAQSHLIENLLDVSRIVEGRLLVAPRPTMVHPVIEGAIDTVGQAAELKRVVIETHLDPKLGAVSIDPNRLHQIVWHLVSNAVKFTPAGGRVTVSAESTGDALRIAVRDTGVGFPPETAQRLFEQFRQGETGSTRPYSGLGLGLAIARHLVERHGGTITARSAGPHRGAEFEVRLPIRAAKTGVPDETAPVEPMPILRGLSILVVDDNDDDRELVRTSLEHYGAVVRTAGSAHEARERFRRDRPDVIVSDLVMPGEDGLELIRQIRAMDERSWTADAGCRSERSRTRRRSPARVEGGLPDAHDETDRSFRACVDDRTARGGQAS